MKKIFKLTPKKDHDTALHTRQLAEALSAQKKLKETLKKLNDGK